jgi:YbbR domain-containing protein
MKIHDLKSDLEIKENSASMNNEKRMTKTFQVQYFYYLKSQISNEKYL